MCGITGWASWNEKPKTSIVKQMTNALSHRGPDSGNIVNLNNVILGHRRLSILDLSKNGNQPMADHSKKIWIVFNGEIYNFIELKKILISKGYRFFNGTDTEVIINAYKHWGISCVKKFNGMFSFSLWDVNKKKLYLVRDRMGEKPLYFFHNYNTLVFSSEIMSLIKHPFIGREINNNALFQYLSLNYTLSNNSLLKDVYKLEPGSILAFENNKPLKITKYWELANHYKKAKLNSNLNELSYELEDLIDKSVKMRMIADVPVGAFLSGGIDSSFVVSSMTKFNKIDKIKTFSAGFKNISFDELKYAKEVANILNVSHKDKKIDFNLIKIFEESCHNMCEPMADTSMIPMYIICKFASENLKVVLTGDGADEILAGYETYKADKIRQILSFLPKFSINLILKLVEKTMPTSHDKVTNEYKLKKFLRGFKFSDNESHYFWKTILEFKEISNILNEDYNLKFKNYEIFRDVKEIYKDVSDCHPLDRNLYVDCKTWLPNDILFKTDRTSMAHGLETRAPFLDHNLVEFCARLPVNYKLNYFQTKYILKKSLSSRLPTRIIKRKKRGFNAPMSNWLLGPLFEYARDLTSNKNLGQIFKPDEIDKIWDNHINFREDNGYKIYGLVCLSKWLQNVKV